MPDATPRLWKRDMTPEQINEFCSGTIHDAIGIRFIETGPDYLLAEMPVDDRNKQPFGLLHGGANVVLAESLGSMASHMVAPDRIAVGVEVNANHLKAARSGKVFGRVSPIRIGNTMHVWQIQIRDEAGDLTCTSRLTVLVRGRQAPST